MPELRECPCCGKPGLVESKNYTPIGPPFQTLRRGLVGCPSCGLFIRWMDDPSWAINTWNTRVTDARLAFREPPLAVAGHDDRVPEGPEGYGSLAL